MTIVTNAKREGLLPSVENLYGTEGCKTGRNFYIVDGDSEGSLELILGSLCRPLNLLKDQQRSSTRERFRTNVFFNIFINDLFQHVKYAKLNPCADDHQIYWFSLDPLALEECICQEVNVANQWYKNNGMIVNKKKHQAVILGKTEHNFSFPVNNSIDIFGVTIDNRHSFDNHVSVICKKINNQFNVMLRFRKLINMETLLKLYKALILPHFYYCSSLWHFCGARNADKVDNLNKRILRVILQDYNSPYDILLSKVQIESLFIRRLQNFMIALYRSLFFYELSRLFKRYVHRTVLIIQFAWKSYPGPSQPKNNDLRFSLLFIFYYFLFS